MRRAFIALIAISAIALTIITVDVSDGELFEIDRKEIPTFDEIPDKILLDKANDLAEVKAFRNRYGEPDEAYVYRAYGLDVYYIEREVDTTQQPHNGTLAGPAVLLQIRFDNDLNVEGMLFFCHNDNGELRLANYPNNILGERDNILKYLEKEECFGRTDQS